MGSTLNPYFYAYNPQLLAYENAWVEYVRNGTRPLPGVIREEVLRSWDRCREAGLHPLGNLKLQKLALPEIERRRIDNANSMKIARTYIAAALMSLNEMDLRIDCIDADGYVLYSLKGNGEGQLLEDVDGEEGTKWSEDAVGTSSVSIVMETKKSAQVVGAEHFLQQHHRRACSAAPFFGNDNEIAGIIRAVGPVEEYHNHTMGMVTSIVKAIENALFINEINDELQQSNDRLTTLLSMVTDGVVHYMDGVIQTVNQEMCRLLDKRPEELIGKPISEIVTTPSIDKIEKYGGDTSSNRLLVLEGRSRSYQCLYDFRRISEGDSSGALLLVTRTEEIQDMAKRITNSASATFSDIVYVSEEMKHQIEIAKKAAAFGSRI